MRALLIHNEAKYFAGAEMVLRYFLETVPRDRCEITVAMVKGSPVERAIPQHISVIELPNNQKFSLATFARQVRPLAKLCKERGFNVLHGWSARDWELSSAAGFLAGVPAIGVLHDHPQAPFISGGRQRLMRGCAKLGLERVVCVSDAVRQACIDAGYPKRRLEVIHNGLPGIPAFEKKPVRKKTRIGFLGVFSERKGFSGFFKIADALAESLPEGWELHVAGGAQGADCEERLTRLKAEYASRAWWPRVEWRGWVDDPLAFTRSVDILVCPSAQFDPLPTVLLEAGAAGTPVIAADVGGVREIVMDGKTGHIFPAGDWAAAAGKIAPLVKDANTLNAMGESGWQRISKEFNSGKMVANYMNLYSTIARS